MGEAFIRILGGSLVRVFITASLVGLFIVVVGMAPGPWVALVLTDPPAWLDHPLVKIGLVLFGVAVIAGGLFMNVFSAKRRALDELANLQSVGINHIWNGHVGDDAGLEAVREKDKKWQGNVEAILRRSFSFSEVIYFTRLGVIPMMTRGNTYNADHAKILREYAVREARLRDILARHSK